MKEVGLKVWPLAASVVLVHGLAHAAEGFWTMDNLPLQRMRSEIGFAPDAQLARTIQLGSVRIDGGCSGSFVSPQGLVMTNHHCVAECIQEVSPAGRNLLDEGFAAKDRAAELRCPGLGLKRLEAIHDVTAEVQRATQGREGEALKQAFEAVKGQLNTACAAGDANTRCDVVKLYQGGQYHQYRYHRYGDVRLVWAPERQIAFFGGDEHNFSFPRYNLDAAFLRVYENDRPAPTPVYLPVDARGAREGEAVLAAGHPGLTMRGITVAQLLAYRDVTLADDMRRTNGLHAALKRHAASGTQAAAADATLLFELENDAKAMQGELQALQSDEALARRRADEQALRRYVERHADLRATVGPAWQAIEQAQATFVAIAPSYYLLEKGYGFSSDLFRTARSLVRAAAERGKPEDERLPEYREAKLAELQERLKSEQAVDTAMETVRLGFALSHLQARLGADHPLVKRVLDGLGPEERAARMVAATRLADRGVRAALLEGGAKAIEQSDDPFIRLAREVDDEARRARRRYEQEVEAVTLRNGELIARARFAKEGRSAYPDGSYTLRMSYGKVQGTAAGKVASPAFTRVAGLFAADTGRDAFALPASWKAAHDKLDPKQPFNFVATLDVSAGSSGSPVLNRSGSVVGMVFDLNSEGLGCVFRYNGATGRAIGLDMGALASALKQVYHADGLLAELGLGGQ